MSDTLIGVSRPRIDAPDKVTGATRFAADGYVHGLLHARPVLATEAHARIRGIDKEAALAIPGVVAVLAAADLPIASTGTDRTSEPLAREEVVFAGQPVALVDRGDRGRRRGRSRGRRRRLRAARARSSTSRRRCGPVLPWRARSRSRTTRAATSSRSTPASTTARRTIPTEELSRQRPRPHHSRERRRRRGVRCERGDRRGDVPDAVGLPGVPRAAGLHRLARAVRHARRLDEHAGLVRDAAASSRARSTSRSSASA